MNTINKNYIPSVTYGILNMTQMNLPTKQNRLTGTENRHVLANGEETGEGSLGVWD